MKKITTTVLIATIFSMASAFAQGGTTGPLTWVLENGTLTISGEGEMPDYFLDNDGPYTTIPWYSYRLSINTVVIETGVTSIGHSAFPNCDNMISITIPNSVISIGGNVFFRCISLISINIPKSVTNIALQTFWYCQNLTSIDVEIENNNYTSENGVLFNKDKTTLIFYPEGKIGSYVISNSTTSIEYCAFESCNNLTSITIPKSVISIGKFAFSNCFSLTTMTNLNPEPVDIKNLYVFSPTIPVNCTLQVPIDAVEGYRNAPVWQDFNIVGIEVGIENIETTDINIYPNPTTGELKIENGELKINNIEIYDLMGKKLSFFNSQISIIDISHFSAGVYFLLITTENGVITRKIEKK